MKYIIFVNNITGKLACAVFPEATVHADVRVKSHTPVSAGFCSWDYKPTGKGSESLKLEAKPGDADVLQTLLVYNQPSDLLPDDVLSQYVETAYCVGLPGGGEHVFGPVKTLAEAAACVPSDADLCIFKFDANSVQLVMVWNKAAQAWESV